MCMVPERPMKSSQIKLADTVSKVACPRNPWVQVAEPVGAQSCKALCTRCSIGCSGGGQFGGEFSPTLANPVRLRIAATATVHALESGPTSDYGSGTEEGRAGAQRLTCAAGKSTSTFYAGKASHRDGRNRSSQCPSRMTPTPAIGREPWRPTDLSNQLRVPAHHCAHPGCEHFADWERTATTVECIRRRINCDKKPRGRRGRRSSIQPNPAPPRRALRSIEDWERWCPQSRRHHGHGRTSRPDRGSITQPLARRAECTKHPGRHTAQSATIRCAAPAGKAHPTSNCAAK